MHKKVDHLKTYLPSSPFDLTEFMNEDWDKPTILRKSRPTSKDLKSNAAVNQALAKGNVEISLKGMYCY